MYFMLLTYVIWFKFIMVRGSFPCSSFSSHSNTGIIWYKTYSTIFIMYLAICCIWFADFFRGMAWRRDTEKNMFYINYINQQDKELFLYWFLHKRKIIWNTPQYLVHWHFQWRMNLMLPVAGEKRWYTTRYPTVIMQEAWYFPGFCCEKSKSAMS